FFSTLKTGTVCALPIIVPPVLPYIKAGQQTPGSGGYSGNPGTGCGVGSSGYFDGSRAVYSYTPPAGTTSINISLVVMPQFADKTGVFVYNSCADFGVNCVAGNTDSSSQQKDILNLPVTPGITYYIVAGSKTTSFTDYSIAITKGTCTSNIEASFGVQTDCNNPSASFYSKVNVSNMGGTTSLELTPIIGGVVQTAQKQVVNALGQYTFGPFASFQKLQMLVQSPQNTNCYILSDILTKPIGCPPTNDNCANPIILSTNVSGLCNPVSGSVIASTTSAEFNNCPGSGNGDVWFEFTAAATDHLINIGGLSNSKLDLNHAVYEGDTCGTLTQLYCESSNQSVATNLIVGRAYKIRVFIENSDEYAGTFNICTSAFPYTCMDDNPLSDTVKGLFINLLNHLLSVDTPLPNSVNGYNCPELIALAPYITQPNPKIYSFSRSNGQMSFSFSGGTNVSLSGIPVGESITNIKFFSYLGSATTASMSVIYGNGDIVNAGNTSKLIEFCPENESCNSVVGNIRINPGMSCMLTGQPHGFALDTDATNITAYSWVFYDYNENIVGTSSLQNPVMTFADSDTYSVELKITTNDGCHTNIKKIFAVVEDCTGFCTENNPQTVVVKNLYIDLVNYLLATYGSGGNVATITTGFNCPQLVALAPYLNDTNPLIYNLSYTSSTKLLKFSFANHGTSAYDVSVINNGPVSDIEILEFSSATTPFNATTLYVNGIVVKSSVMHVNFCPGICAPLTGTVNLDSGISCTLVNKPTLFNFQTTSSTVVSYAWTFYAANSTTTVLTTSALPQPSYSYTTTGNYQIKLIATYGSGCTSTFWKSITVSNTCTTCTETNPKSADVKLLYLNLINHLMATGGVNVSNPYNCSQLEALSPYITDNNPQIWNLTFTGGVLKFSFNNHGTDFDVSVPNTAQISDINLINYSSNITPQTFSTTYANGTVSSLHSIKHIDFCPSTECVLLFGEIKLDQGLSCIPLNVQQEFHLQADKVNVTNYLWTFYNQSGNIYTTNTDADPVMTYNVVGNYLVKLVVTENTGCVSTFYKTITVSATCGTSCTEISEESGNVKDLYIALLNHLLKKSSIPNGYTCLELSMLSSYITDMNPAIYNAVWNGQVLSFSFSPGDAQPDVVIGKYGTIGDVNLFNYSTSTVNCSPIVTYTNGTVSKTHTVKHISFCPPTNVCESHVAFVIDESASIDSSEAEKIKFQLRKFIEQQLAFGTTTTISFIGMSDSDTDTRTDHVQSRVTLDTKQDFDNWISNYKSNYTPVREAMGISANSDYWASGLRRALETETDIIIMITDGSQTSDVSELKELVNQANRDSHLYVYGIGEGYYIDGNSYYGQSIFISDMETTGQWPSTATYPAGQQLITYDTTQAHTGNNSLKIHNAGASTEVYVYSNSVVDINNNQPREYTYSAWVKSETAQAELWLTMKTETEPGFYTYSTSVNSIVKNGWQYIEGKYIVPANIKKLSIRLDCNGSVPADVWFDDIKITEKVLSNPNGSQPISEVTSSLMSSLQFLMGLPSTQFPVSGQVDILSSSYYAYSDFTHLENEITYFSDRLAYSRIGCGGAVTPKDLCDDCETFQPYPTSDQAPITYWMSAWVMEEQNIQVKKYTNAIIHLIFEDENEKVIVDMPFLPSGDIIDGWQRIAAKFEIPADTSIMRIELENASQGIPVYFDDIRLHPLNGSMKSFVYDPETFRLVAEHDSNNYATFYEYDKEGGLVRIKKETSKGVKTIQESRSGSIIQSGN
ncbi:VWA domain-containing protein, partial [Flavobacterium sp. NRK1]|uniref:VWA domain-containing protein n=1 Tax=Flavobacterium sp. NRK1 TaxID=2954929 RepID=UPI0020921A93